ncbi:hypothetical protein RND81_04G028500 [Saponaria officinalis]|uniref:Aminotransferase-like plant mobile domain-containing protein n=1 Tax=Saponaria officinalis TaxID=3572 RepID=A0AAW1LHB3_SAPOF
MQYPRHLDRWCSEEDLDGLKTPHPVLLPSNHKQKDHFPSFEILRTSITKEKAHWSATPRFGCEFTYTPNYWEWLEDIIRQCRADLRATHILEAVHASLFLYSRNTSLMESFCEHWCPKTDTLVTATRETSISLWDIRTLANLPITGLLYDEVVPSLAELLDSSPDGNRHLPPSFRYLFAAFHVILSKRRSKTKVNFEDWCRFWFKGASKYSSSNIPISKEDFVSYGDAAPWDNTIHAVASLLASGQKISLAISMLASICRGLNDISASYVPGKSSGYFASHYVYAWLAKFYRSQRASTCKFIESSMAAFGGEGSLVTMKSGEARDLIPSGQKINWHAIPFGGVKQEMHVDNAHSSLYNTESLIAMRSSFLTLRYEDNNIVEPYSPHRFGRQFGFCQDVPGELEYDIREGSNERLFQLFGSSVLLEMKSRFVLPKGDLRLSILTTPAYDTLVETSYLPMFPVKKVTRRKSPEGHRDKNETSLGKRKLQDRVTRTTYESPAASTDALKKRGLRVKSTHDRAQQPAKKTSPPPKDKTRFDDKVRKVTPSPPKSVEKVSAPTSKRNSSSVPPDGDKSEEENILHIFDHSLESDDLNCTAEMFSKQDVNIADEVAASNKSLDDLDSFDDDLFIAVNDPQIRGAVSFLLEPETELKADRTIEPEFEIQREIMEVERQAVFPMVYSKREKLLRSSHEDLPRHMKELELVFDYAKSKNVDVSEMQARAKTYLDSESQLDSLKREFQKKPSTLDTEEKLKVVILKKERLKKELEELCKE